METFIFFLLCVGGAVIIYFRYKSDQRRKNQKQDKLNHLLDTIIKAETDYRKGLSELKRMPTNADLKELVLSLGREYSGLTRRFQGIDGITLVDEVGIMNDINAACATATPMLFEKQNNQTIEHRLEKLSELKSRNLINEQEYIERKQEILDEI